LALFGYIVGQEEVVEQADRDLLPRPRLLVGVPGLAKTLLVSDARRRSTWVSSGSSSRRT
jgi:MoxR-like ATPase